MKDNTFWRSGDPNGWSSKQVLATFMTINGDLEWVDTRGNTHVGIVCEMEVVQTEAPGTATYSNNCLKSFISEYSLRKKAVRIFNLWWK